MYIGKAAQLSGATIKSIRHYERIGLLPAPRRQGSYRLYDQQSIALLSLIKCAQKLGFSLKEMQTLVAEEQAGLPIEKVRQAIAGKKAQVQAQIQALQLQHQGLLELEISLEHSQYDCFAYNA
ncbi:MerR family transcriptional regulator [Pseudomonas rubra]|uniref:MerR family transcriptional regulator n=1 Tax=Pseudomonas rubra TaxID=2942627 RepID=A0ABT5P7V3_9PSED|nr:MerR family transcriptional regulator [Pseudomonas rubra]MDD1014384.1 MerR family transcriptional regulator [Pseudomonas rubra]MDD1037993.1 MerR family transcriptional regulator [Pseudomonas rubra]MDD1155426.1 MerR family transcriptional regulator [Pseudomonas rubra]